VIRESVEPLLEEYRPPGITSLKFSKLSLGNVAPKIEGIIKKLCFLFTFFSLVNNVCFSLFFRNNQFFFINGKYFLKIS
jgi:hypothetical protein